VVTKAQRLCLIQALVASLLGWTHTLQKNRFTHNT
jgi:hypothetical protein